MPPNDNTRLAPRAVAARIAAGVGAAAILATTAACGGADPEIPEPPNTDITPQELTAENADAWLDTTIPDMLEQNGIAGATVAVVGDGEVLTTRGFGHADTGEGGSEPVEVDPAEHLFRIGSVSKVFTATAVMQLVERGELDLDTDVSAYLDFEIERGFEDDLTLRHLLTHTPGFEERVAGLMTFGEGTADLREALVTDPPEQVYRPGTLPSYSNYGNALAGYIVQRVSGESFEDYVENHIFEPLGMASSTFRQPLPDDLRGRLSNGYIDADGPAQEFEVVSTPPAGSLSMTADDMAQFMLAQLGALPEQFRVTSDATREQMFTPALGQESLGDFAAGDRMTLGWFQEDRNGHRVVGHGGDTNLFHSHLSLYPDDGAGIFISLNSAGAEGSNTVTMRQEVTDGFADRFFPAEPNAEAEPFDEAATSDDAERIAGTYVGARGFHSTFLSALDMITTTEITALDDGRIHFDADPGTGEPGVYEQVGESLWQEVDGPRRISVRTENGEVTGINHDAALTLLPLEGYRAAGLPILIGAASVLLLGLLAWPVGAIWRKLRKSPAVDRSGRLWRVLVRVGAACTLTALACWVAIVLSAMELTEISDGTIRAVQALQLLGALAMAPAAVKLIGEIRRRSGWRTITGTVLMLLALSSIGNLAIEFQLLSPNISY